MGRASRLYDGATWIRELLSMKDEIAESASSSVAVSMGGLSVSSEAEDMIGSSDSSGLEEAIAIDMNCKYQEIIYEISSLFILSGIDKQA